MRGSGWVRKGLLLAATGVLLDGCAHHRSYAVAEPEQAPVAQIPPRPALPGQYAAVAVPVRATDGGYQTINSGIDSRQTAWHVRAALNVAAIGCRSAADATLTASYNSLLASQRAELAADNEAVEARFRQQFGKSWQGEHDAYMTRLYNYFAQPFAKAAFCAAADQVAPQAAAVPAGGFQRFAATALPQLEAPFLAVYRQIDEYRLASAQWDAQYGAGAPTRVAAATTRMTAPAAGYGSADLAPMAATSAPVSLALASETKAERKAEKKAAHVKLAYADLRAVMAWQPRKGVALAFR